MAEISEDEFRSMWEVQVAASGDLFVYQEIRDFPEQHVWTIVETACHGDGNWYALPGRH